MDRSRANVRRGEVTEHESARVGSDEKVVDGVGEG